MRRMFGWILIALLILAALLPVWPYSYPILETHDKEIQGWDRYGNPITITVPAGDEWVYVTKYTWWLFAIPCKEGGVILGEIAGYIGFWILGIWLIKRKSKKQDEIKPII